MTPDLRRGLPAGRVKFPIDFLDDAVVEKFAKISRWRDADEFSAHGDVFFQHFVRNPALGGEHRQCRVVIHFIKLALPLSVFTENRNRLLSVATRVLPAFNNAAQEALDETWEMCPASAAT